MWGVMDLEGAIHKSPERMVMLQRWTHLQFKVIPGFFHRMRAANRINRAMSDSLIGCDPFKFNKADMRE